MTSDLLGIPLSSNQNKTLLFKNRNIQQTKNANSENFKPHCVLSERPKSSRSPGIFYSEGDLVDNFVALLDGQKSKDIKHTYSTKTIHKSRVKNSRSMITIKKNLFGFGISQFWFTV